ncbi:MAG TPA: ABC transporter substrate-binding protein [Opitutus sp.]|nr:ABC transporter substrate-binding protein [Opitutus sp.]
MGRIFQFFVWGAAGFFLAGPRMPAAGGAALDHVVLQLKWKHQFQFAGYYAAVAQGYYREVGLEVELREAVPGEDPVHEVLEGRADFGVGTSELVLLRDRGQPVVVLAAIFQHSPLVLLARRVPGVEDVQALHDQPIMIEPQSAELFAYFKYEGVDPARLHIMPHTFEVHDLIAGRVEAMSAYSSDEPFLLKEAGLDYLTFTPRAGGIDFYGDNLFTVEKQIREHPARVRAFLAASLRGWEYAMAHKAELVDLILRKYGPRKSRAHLLFEAEQTDLLMHPGLIEIGHMNPGRWRHIAATYAEFGMLPRPFALDGFVYDLNPRPNLAWLYWLLGVLGVVAFGALGWALPLARLNARLRAAKEAAEAADHAKTRFLAFLTHEIRTPMNGLATLVALLKDDALRPEQRQQVELVEQSTQQLLATIDGVLDYSKLEAGRMEADLRPVTLPDFLHGLCELFGPAARAKGLTLEYELGADVPAAIVTDALRLRQILANLLSNAIKFTAQGRVMLAVEAWPAGPATGGAVRHRVAFTVRDTGIGIAPDRIGRLFAPFVQADASIAPRFGGTGLGLSISRGLAQLLGGDIRVDSTMGEGSAFTVEIVAVEAVAEPG